MSSRLLRRRSATAAWIYAAVACAFAGTVVAARVLGLADYGVFATALVTVGFFQTLLDLTVEESLTKFGFRYVAGEEWGRLRRLFRQALLLEARGRLRRDDAPRRSRALRRRAVRRGRHRAGDPRGCAPSSRAGVGERRCDRTSPAQPVRPTQRLPGRVLGPPPARDRLGVHFGVVEALLAIVVAQAISTFVISVMVRSRSEGSRSRHRRTSPRTFPRSAVSCSSRASQRV